MCVCVCVHACAHICVHVCDMTARCVCVCKFETVWVCEYHVFGFCLSWSFVLFCFVFRDVGKHCECVFACFMQNYPWVGDGGALISQIFIS